MFAVLFLKQSPSVAISPILEKLPTLCPIHAVFWREITEDTWLHLNLLCLSLPLFSLWPLNLAFDCLLSLSLSIVTNRCRERQMKKYSRSYRKAHTTARGALWIWCLCYLFVDIGAFVVVVVSQALVPRREAGRRRTNSFCFLSKRGRAERGERCPSRLVSHMLEINGWFTAPPQSTSHVESYCLYCYSLIPQGFPTYLLHSSVSDCRLLSSV